MVANLLPSNRVVFPAFIASFFIPVRLRPAESPRRGQVEVSPPCLTLQSRIGLLLVVFCCLASADRNVFYLSWIYFLKSPSAALIVMFI